MGASLVAQMVKCLSAMQGTRVWSLGWEDPLEKKVAAHSSILAWKIPWTVEPGSVLSIGLQRVEHDWATSLHFTSDFYWVLLFFVFSFTGDSSQFCFLKLIQNWPLIITFLQLQLSKPSLIIFHLHVQSVASCWISCFPFFCTIFSVKDN